MITEQQVADRTKGIGGSDLPIILGLSSYKTPYQLFLEKTGIIVPTQEESQLQYWGNRLECLIREEFALRNGVAVETPDTIIHPFHNFLRGNVDGFIPEWNSVLEVKCSSAFMASEWGEDGSDVIPMPYLVQVAHYCSCLNADSAYIAVLIGGNDYRQFKYTRDFELEKTVIDAATSFWTAVQNNAPPPATNQLDLRLMFPKHAPDKAIDMNTDIEHHVNKLVDIKKQLKELSDIENDYKLKIMSHMKDAEYLLDSEKQVACTWKTNKRGSRIFLLKGA